MGIYNDSLLRVHADDPHRSRSHRMHNRQPDHGIASGYKHRPAHRSLPSTILRTASIGVGIGLPANAVSTLTGYYYISNMFTMRSADEALLKFTGTIILILGLNIASPTATWFICRAYLRRQSSNSTREN